MAALAITAGEPAGIGPDLCVEIAQQAWQVPLVVIADPALLEQRAATLKRPLRLLDVGDHMPQQPALAKSLYVLPTALDVEARCGQLDRRNGDYVLNTLDQAVDGCRDGRFAAMITAPVHKGVINDAGHAFTGHTEYLAARCGNDVHPVMMLAAPGLRVALATTHLALRDVADAITHERLERVIRILHRDLRARFSIEKPRILVCGLNPHAGEDGHLGREEIDVIEPLLEQLRDAGIDLHGPLPADTLFTPPFLREADAVLAMYHDQGLPVLKHMGFGDAVNITLGLPIVRTSVDHGTALDLAGSGKANASSMLAAIEQAIAMTG